MPQKLIQFIKQNGLEALNEKYAIQIKRHPKFNNLVMLKYNQIHSPMDNDIVQKCRGIILDEYNDWKVVCYSFNKFFNYLEPNAAKIDWDTAKVYNKIDGSLCQLYFYDKWRVASSGTPDASGRVNDFDFTFAELFWRVWEELKYKLPEDKNMCYAFELCTPFNRVVVQHDHNDLVFLSARRLSDFKELNPVIEAHKYGWKCVDIFPFKDQESVLSALGSMNGSEQEGFVVCDGQYNRVKMKAEDYLKKHRLVSGMTQRNMLDAIRTNESSEVLVYCPQFKELHDEIRSKYDYMCGQIDGFYDATKHIEHQKDFALLAKDKKFAGVLFNLRHGKSTNVKDALAEMDIKRLEDLLGLKEEQDEQTGEDKD